MENNLSKSLIIYLVPTNNIQFYHNLASNITGIIQISLGNLMPRNAQSYYFNAGFIPGKGGLLQLEINAHFVGISHSSTYRHTVEHTKFSALCFDTILLLLFLSLLTFTNIETHSCELVPQILAIIPYLKEGMKIIHCKDAYILDLH